MAKKKNNTKRNLAVGAGTILAGGLALKSGIARKAYNSLSRVGKKRGKYNTNGTIQALPATNNSAAVVKPRTQKQINNSAKIQSRREKLKYNTTDATYLQSANSKLKAVTDQLKILKTDPNKANTARLYQAQNLQVDAQAAMRAEQASTALQAKRFNLRNKQKKEARALRKEVDRLRESGEYSKNLYLISDFTLM